MNTDLIDPAANLRALSEELKGALLEAGRAPDAVQITAVTKTQDAGRILPVLEIGHRRFGENRVQEAQGKWPALRAQFDGIELHLIGPLQSNKAKEAVALFDVIETIDRPKIARAISEEMRRQNRKLDLLVQVNTGEEPQKAGIIPADTDAFILQCNKDYDLNIAGLMCIPPVDQDPAPHFALLVKIAARNGLDQLSMGMSADYLIAAQLGATSVRVGSGIFGARG